MPPNATPFEMDETGVADGRSWSMRLGDPLSIAA